MVAYESPLEQVLRPLVGFSLRPTRRYSLTVYDERHVNTTGYTLHMMAHRRSWGCGGLSPPTAAASGCNCITPVDSLSEFAL